MFVTTARKMVTGKLNVGTRNEMKKVKIDNF